MWETGALSFQSSHLPSTFAPRNAQHLASSLASHLGNPAPRTASLIYSFRKGSLDATLLMAQPPVSHIASALVPLAQRDEVTHGRTLNLHATVDPSLRSVDGTSHKQCRIGSLQRARPVQPLALTPAGWAPAVGQLSLFLRGIVPPRPSP